MSDKMVFNISNIDQSLTAGLNVLAVLYGFTFGENGLKITAVKSQDKGFKIESQNGLVTIYYSEKVLFFTAFSYILQSFGKEFTLQKTRIDRLGVMRDSARNGILSVNGFKKVIPYLALMGYNYIELYTEDLYDIKNYPYLGANRGRYTAEEIKQMDDFAFDFGIELMPCIQTLAHLPNAFRNDAFNDICDIDDVLLMGDENTYTFIESVIAFCAKNFRSRRINIGMDEAHRMCRGKFALINGVKDRAKQFIKHLNRVLDICRKYDLSPSMWSDMIFKVGLDIHVLESYVGMDGKSFSQEFLKEVPKDVTLIFWDYYHTQKDFYTGVLDRHFEITDKVAFAGGVWSWHGFAPFNSKTQRILDSSISACLEKGCQDFSLTAWGDGGGECLFMPTMSSYLYASEKLFGGNDLDNRAKAIFGYSFEDLKATERVNALSETYMVDNAENGVSCNVATYLLYNDPLIGLLDAHCYNEQKKAFNVNAKQLYALAEKGGALTDYFNVYASLADYLSLRCTLGKDCRNAYLNGDKQKLLEFAKNVIPECERLLSKFVSFYNKAWLSENKSFGFEVQNIRFGALKKRLKTAKTTINEYLIGKIDRIDEFENKPLPVCSFMTESEDIGFNLFRWNITASEI